MGCSGGGIQAMIQAQYYPWDFDGIVASDFQGGNRSILRMAMAWNARWLIRADGSKVFGDNDVSLLHQAALDQCDNDDGVLDGVISHPTACNFNVRQLACQSTESSSCLSDEKVIAAEHIYTGVVTSNGDRITSSRTTIGSEENAMFGFGVTNFIKRFIEEYFRYMAFLPDPGPEWTLQDLDFDEDYKRLGMMSALQIGNLSPDLRQFKSTGGKLIITQGWHDSGSPMVLAAVDYYENLEKIMGGREETQKFARLYMMPGRAHCGAGPGAHSFDMLSSLERWVEQGEAPDVMIGAHVRGAEKLMDQNYDFYSRFPENEDDIKFTRPVYPYPLRAQYSGAGNPDEWKNWKPVESQIEWEKLK